MSGIAAVYSTTNGAPLERDIALLLRAVAGRGTGESRWLSPQVALGQRHLPTTPEAVSQALPTSVLGGRCQIALDGRIDNRRELLQMLAPDGRQPAPNDADLIAYAYDRWGADCAERLIGDFAFVLWDETRGQLIAVRDQRGFRPLVYARAGERIVIASEARALLAIPGLSGEIDEMFFACHLTGAPPRSGSTPYRSVSEVPPGHMLVIKNGETRLREYWRFGPRPLLRLPAAQDYVEAFEAVMKEAVASSLRVRKGAGVLLSGGLDSSYVLALSAGLDARVRAFNAFSESADGMDERTHSRAVAERLGVALREVSADDTWSLSSNYLSDDMFDQPAVPLQAPLMVKMAQAAEDDGVDVLIDGMGGDEFLSGPREYIAQLLSGGHLLRAARETLRWSRRDSLPLQRIVLRTGLIPLLPSALRERYRNISRRQPLRSLPCWIDSAALASTGLADAMKMPTPGAAWNRAAQTERFWALHRRDTLPVNAWRERHASLPHGVEARSPFWDLRVLELTLRIPEWVHRESGQTKAVLRRAMSPRLPETVTNRGDKGTFDGLFKKGLLEKEPTRLEEALHGPLSELPYVDLQAIETELEDYRRYGHPWWHGLWRAVTGGLWLQQNSVTRGRVADRLIPA